MYITWCSTDLVDKSFVIYESQYHLYRQLDHLVVSQWVWTYSGPHTGPTRNQPAHLHQDTLDWGMDSTISIHYNIKWLNRFDIAIIFNFM